MSDLFTKLPTNIVSEILSHISQHDCMESMRVCHEWFESIPTLAKSRWTTLNFGQGASTITTYNGCLIQCLGSHVQVIKLPLTINCIETLDKLKKCHCMITEVCVQPSLGDCIDLEQKEAVFLDILQLVGNDLVKLTLFSYFNPSLLGIARLCPHLTDLNISTYHQFLRDSRHFREPDELSNTSVMVLLPQLTYLKLDGAFSFFRIEALLRQCPNLQVLQLSNIFHLYGGPLLTDIDFVRIVDSCPRLYHLGCNFGSQHRLDPPRPQQEQPLLQLREVTYDDSNHAPDPTVFLSFLHQLQDTLTTLDITQHVDRYSFDKERAWLGLGNVILPHLKHATIISEETINLVTLCQFLNNHSTVLEYIFLWVSADLFDEDLLGAICNVVQVKSLFLRISPPSNRRCSIPSISKDNSTSSTDNRTYNNNSTVYHLFPRNSHLLLKLQHLQHLKIFGHLLVFPDATMEALSNLPSLQSVLLRQYGSSTVDYGFGLAGYYSLPSKKSMIKFIADIAHQGRVQDLILAGFNHSLDDEVMEAIGDIKSLVSLSIGNTHSITDRGIRLLIDKKTASSSLSTRKSRIVDKLQELRIKECKNITQNGIVYARAKLGKSCVIQEK